MKIIFKYLAALAVVAAFCSTAQAQKLGFVGVSSLNHGTIVSTDENASFLSIPGGGYARRYAL